MHEWQQRPTKGLFLFSRPSLQVLATQRRTDGLVLRSCAHKDNEVEGSTQRFPPAFCAGNWVKAAAHTTQMLNICSVPSLRQDASNGCTTALHCWPAAANRLRPPWSPLCLCLVQNLSALAVKLEKIHWLIYSTNLPIVIAYSRVISVFI